MASSSFSPILPSSKVFVSFRGEDTRNSFTSHLVAALQRKAIDTYIDNKLDRGEEISPTLMEAIEDSDISIVVISRNYASSRWCLNELSRIIECKQISNQIVVPIFYHVDPSDVRNQRGNFAEAFVEHVKIRAVDEVERWRSALNEVANLSGWHLQGQLMEKCESEFIEEIVKDISTKLISRSSSNFQGLVAIDSRIKQIESKLHSKLEEVVIVGIWGMGGIGKTTIAEAVFHQISAEFEGSFFLANVREDSQKYGLKFLRNKLLSVILEERNLDIGTSLLPSIIHNRLQRKKVLIVLDDVNDSMQLDILPHWHCFGPGSRIIITSRDKQVLQQVVDTIYKVEELTDDEALQLFSLFAFKQSYPEEGFMELSKIFSAYAKGIPLALKVLGSALNGKSKRDWINSMHKLKETPNPKVDNLLRISYDELDDEEKDIFLDIACFFKGENVGYVTETLKGCNFSADIGVSVLMDKSLISITESTLQMHDLLQEMGRNIVRQESTKEPGKRSRLWKHEDIYQVLKNNTGTEAVEGMFLDISRMRELRITPKAFARMKNLRMLKFYTSTLPKDRKLYLTGNSLPFLSDRLSYLHWDGYPLKMLPFKFSPENLVELHMPESNVKRLWKGVQDLVKLKRLDLSGSKHLIEIPNLCRAINVERMDLRNCASLVDVSSIQYMNKLHFLSLSCCKNLGDLPNCSGLTSLRNLYLYGCTKITKFPEVSGNNIELLSLSGTGIQEVSSSIGDFSRLKWLHLCDCKRLQRLPRSLCNLKSLEHLSLSSFPNLEGCLEVLRSVESVEILCSKRRAIKEIKWSIKQLNGLVIFTGKNSAETGSLQNSIRNMKSLKKLIAFGCSELGELPYNLQNLQSLQFVKLIDCNLLKFPSCLTYIFSLSHLDLRRNDFKSIPASIKQLLALEWLDLRECKRLLSLPKLPPRLQYLNTDECTSLAAVSTLLNLSLHGRKMMFTNCLKLDPNVMEDEARLTILHKAKEDVKLYTKGRGKNNRFSICYPGSDIPKWFSFQNMGSSITIKRPPNLQNKKFLGISLCAVVTFLDQVVDCSFKTKNGACHSFVYPLVDWEGESQPQRYKFLGSDHVLIGYSSCFYGTLFEFEDSHCTEASFEFPINPYVRQLPGHIIKKCGVCLLYG